MRRGLRSARTAEFWAAVLLCVGLVIIATAHVASADTEGLRSRSGNLVNQARRAEGVAALQRHTALDHVATVHAQRMADAGSIFHNDRLAQEVEAQGVKWKRLGENVGMGPSVEVVHDGFMDSEAHRHNVLQPQFHAFGVGVVAVREGDRDKVYVVHVFGDLTQAPKENTTTHHMTPTLRTPPPAPKPVAAAPVVARVVPVPSVRPALKVKTSPEPNALTGGIVAPTRQ